MNVFIIVAISADGFIARNTNELANWTSAEDKKLFVKLTKEAGTMVMGATTFKTIGKALPGRKTIVYTTHPDQISSSEVETTREDPTALISRLQNEGARSVAICGGSSIYTLFIKANLVDEIYLTVEPIIFGDGIKLFSESIEKKLSLIDSQQLNSNVTLFHYKIEK